MGAALAGAGAAAVGALADAHEAFASAPSDWYNVKLDYGAVGDGVTDDTTALRNALSAANAAGGGIVYFPHGTYYTRTLTLYSDVHLLGAGIGATTLQLGAGHGGPILITDQFASLTGTNQQAGPEKFSVRNMMVDGNKANGTSGPTVQIYGKGYIIDSVQIINGPADGLYSEWASSGDDMEAMICNFRVRDCVGTGINWNGPHDSQFINGEIIRAGNVGLDQANNAAGEQLVNVHVWGSQSVALHIRNGAYLLACEGEGSTSSDLYIDGNEVIAIGCHFWNAPTCIQFGTVGGAAPSRCLIDSKVGSQTTAGINFANSGPYNTIRLMATVDQGIHAMSGTPSPYTSFQMTVDGDNTNAGWFRTGQQDLVGFFGVPPVAQAAAIPSPASDTSGTKAAIDDIRTVLKNLGLTQ